MLFRCLDQTLHVAAMPSIGGRRNKDPMLIGARLVQVTVVQSDIDRAYAFHGRSPFGLMSMGETSRVWKLRFVRQLSSKDDLAMGILFWKSTDRDWINLEYHIFVSLLCVYACVLHFNTCFSYRRIRPANSQRMVIGNSQTAN